MKLRATETPIATPRPAPPAPTAAATAKTLASMPAVFMAVAFTGPELSMTLSSMWALTFVRMTLVAAAPAPLMPAPTLPTAIESAAATVQASIIAPSVAERLIPVDVVALTFVSASAMYAETSFAIVFQARATPTATPTPKAPPIDAAIDAAPTMALIVEVSLAVIEALSTVMPVEAVPSPSM